VKKNDVRRIKGDLILGERADLYIDGSLFVDGTIYINNYQSDVRIFGEGEIISRMGMHVDDTSKLIVGDGICWNMLVEELHPFIDLKGLSDSYVVSYFNFNFIKDEVSLVSRCYNHKHSYKISITYLEYSNF